MSAALRAAEARIHDLDRARAPGSETALLGHALEDIRQSDDPGRALAWWEGAYRMHAWAEQHPDEASELYGGRWGGDWIDGILHDGEDLTDWYPPAPTPDALRAWREHEGLSQSRAASVAGVDIRTWQRWEGSEVEIPHWLADVLHRRWGTGP